MTVTAKTTRVQYTGNGAVKTYAYDWKILEDDNLVVVSTDSSSGSDVNTVLTLTTDYTVTGAGNDSGGNVVLTNNLASGLRLTVYMDMDVDQPTDLTNQASPFLERIESALDRQALISQQLAEGLSRSIKLDPSSTDTAAGLQALLESVDTNATIASGAKTDALAAQSAAEAAQGLAEDARDAALAAESTATSAAGTATTQAGIATSAAGTATTKAGEASDSADAAASSAGTATAQAEAAALESGIAATKAADALASAEDAAVSADIATAALGIYRHKETVTGSPKTTFTLPWSYDHTTKAITVYIDGVYQDPAGFTCPSSTSVTLDANAAVGETVYFVSGLQVAPDLSGYMVGSNNLAELTNKSAAQANLDLEPGVDVQAYDATILKSADIGTTAGKLIALNGSGKLPAVDASLLTNLPVSSPLGIIKTTRNMTAASGSVDYTIAGETRTPTQVRINGWVSANFAVNAFCDGTTIWGYDVWSGDLRAISGTIYLYQTTSVGQYTTSVTLITGGVRIAWTKDGSPTGTINLVFELIF